MTSAPTAPGIERTDLQQHDLSAEGRAVIQNRIDISPDATVNALIELVQ
jgi:hypothetical protein